VLTSVLPFFTFFYLFLPFFTFFYLLQLGIDVFVIIDGNLQYQQKLSDVTLAIIVLKAPDNTFETLRPLVPKILIALVNIRPGDTVHVEA
jgi:hypothetical protein